MAVQPGFLYDPLVIYFATHNSLGGLAPGVGAPDGAYIMRAYKTTPTTGYVYWISYDKPDLTGEDSGYSPGDLTDIIIQRPPCVRDPRDLP